MKIMILGASYGQINAINKAKSLGLKVLAVDFYKDSIGKKIADEVGLASTFDFEGCFKIAKEKNIDAIITTATDQPVYTVSRISNRLGLFSFLDVETAHKVTNKKLMKNEFTKANIPTVDYRVIHRSFTKADIKGLDFPVVVKPLDSQGQRGVYKLNSFEDIKRYFDKVISFSRENEILVESYYKNDEITVSGWANDGTAKILTITDRITFDNEKYIGICLSHEFPSRYIPTHLEEITRITNDLVDAFCIKNGPIYFQMFIGDQGIKVNEIACRIGGAYEDEFIPFLTGIDILKMQIDASIGRDIDYEKLNNYSIKDNNKHISVHLFFAKKGNIKKISYKK